MSLTTNLSPSEPPSLTIESPSTAGPNSAAFNDIEKNKMSEAQSSPSTSAVISNPNSKPGSPRLTASSSPRSSGASLTPSLALGEKQGHVEKVKRQAVRPPSLTELTLAMRMSNPERWEKLKQETADLARSTSLTPSETASGTSSRLKLLPRTGSSVSTTSATSGGEEDPQPTSNGGVEEERKGRKGLPSLDQIRRKVQEKSSSVKEKTEESKPNDVVTNGGGRDSKESKEAEKEEVKDVKADEKEEGEIEDTKEKDATVASSPSASDEKKEEEHPLRHIWTMYFDSRSTAAAAARASLDQAQPSPEPTGKVPSPPNTAASHHPGGQAYEATLQVIGEFKTVESFCRYFNWTKRPSQLEVGSNVHVFKDGIKPMWEDTANQEGGKWVLTVKKQDNELLDRCWMWLVLALIGEVLDEKNEVCGAVVSLKPRGHRIQLWTRSKSDVEGINSLGKRLIKLLEIEQEPGIQFEFQSHGGAPPAGSTNGATKFISINNYAHIQSSGSIRRGSSNADVGTMGPPLSSHRTTTGSLGFAGFANTLGDKLNNAKRPGGGADGWRGSGGGLRGFGNQGMKSNKESGSYSSTPIGGSREGSRQGSRVGSRATSPEPPNQSN